MAASRSGWRALWAPAFVLASAAQWAWRPFGFIGEDEYFYVIIARNIAAHGASSFNLVYDTNGYHPLWLWLLSLARWALPAQAVPDYAIVVALSGALLLVGALLYRKSAARLGLDTLPLGICLPLFFLTNDCLGSEAYLGFALLAGLFALWSAPEQGSRGARLLATGLLAALLALARLDYVFVLALAVAALGVRELRAGESTTRERAWNIVLLVLPVLLLLAPYLAWNRIRFGALMPVSGLTKSTFPDIFAPSLWKLGPLGSFTFVISALGLAARDLGRGRTHARAILDVGCGAALLQGLYVICFTNGHGYWNWYYVLGSLNVALIADLSLSRAGAAHSTRRLALAAGVVALLAATALNALKACYPGIDRLSQYAVLARSGPQAVSQPRWQDRIAAFLKSQPDSGRVTVWDWPGRIAYGSGLPVIPLDGLVGNAGFDRELRERGLRDYLRHVHAAWFVGPTAIEGDDVQSWGTVRRVPDGTATEVRPISPLSRVAVTPAAFPDRDEAFRAGPYAVWRVK